MNELTDFQRQYLKSLKEEEKEELSKNADIINSFKEFMAKQGIFLTDESFKYFQTTGIIATYPNIVKHLHSSLKNDKEGLMNFKNLCQSYKKNFFNNGYLYSDNFVLMAHSYFRRGFEEINNYTPRFIELFWNLDDPDIDTYISIDIDRVKISIDGSSCMELDTWYGPHFNRNIETIPDDIVKLRPPIDIDNFLNSFLFQSAYALDIKWTTKDKIKTFQAEEFKTDEVKLLKNGVEYYPVKYIHAEYDLEKKCFRHFDGAIHFYTSTEYYNRRDSDFNYNYKRQNHIKTLSQKLFKMNGQVSVDAWIEFSSHFFAKDPLVFEYFEGQYPQHVSDILDAVRLHNSENANIT